MCVCECVRERDGGGQREREKERMHSFPEFLKRFTLLLRCCCFPSGKFCNTFFVVQTLAYICEVTNSSVNFIVYFSMGSRFRATVRDMFGTRRPKAVPATESLPTVSQEV